METLKRHGAGVQQAPHRIGLTAIFTICAVIALPAHAGNSLQDARDYVLAACISHVYSGKPLAQESEVWAQGLVESGNLPGTAYKPLSELAKKVPPAQTSAQGTPMLMQSCVNWYNSTELKSAIQKVLIKRKGS
jgi:hypothetical protein